MKTLIKTNLFLLSLILVSMLFSALPSFADVTPPPLSYIEAYINHKGQIIFPSPEQIKAYSPRVYYSFKDVYNYENCKLQPTYVDGAGWGFSDKNNKIIIKPKFEFVLNFGEGLAAARKDKKWGFINEKGDWVIQPKFPSVACYEKNSDGQYYPVHKCYSSSVFSEGLAPIIYAEEDGKYANRSKYGYIDKTGKVVIKGNFVEARPFSDGLAVVRNDYYQFGYIDKTGKSVINPQFNHAGSFSGGIALVEIPAYAIILKFSSILLVLAIIAGISIRKSKYKEIDDKSQQD